MPLAFIWPVKTPESDASATADDPQHSAKEIIRILILKFKGI
jgi:hypothetical protein